MAKWFYPDEFEDLDLQSIHQEYVDKFCGIYLDVTKHGVVDIILPFNFLITGSKKKIENHIYILEYYFHYVV